MVLARGKTKTSTRKDFRGSIAWLSGWLSTYHEVGCPSSRKTRFRPLVRRYRTGFHPQGSIKRFLDVSYIHPPFPSFLAQSPLPPSFIPLDYPQPIAYPKGWPTAGEFQPSHLFLEKIK